MKLEYGFLRISNEVKLECISLLKGFDFENVIAVSEGNCNTSGVILKEMYDTSSSVFTPAATLVAYSKRYGLNDRNQLQIFLQLLPENKSNSNYLPSNTKLLNI
jgi:hypothetical protein